MDFDYSFFISYRHAEGRLMTKFMDQLIQGLKDYTEPYLDLPMFHDREGLEGGDFYDDKFGRALIRSVCMILVYTPTYFDRRKTYCTREFFAMEQIETIRCSQMQRCGLPKESFVVPIILKGRLPEYIAQKRDYRYDFSRFTLSSEDISRHELYAEWFDQIGQRIRRIYDLVLPVPIDHVAELTDLRLPTDRELPSLLDKVTPNILLPLPGRVPHGT
jgi:hypothetical protein